MTGLVLKLNLFGNADWLNYRSTIVAEQKKFIEDEFIEEDIPMLHKNRS